jgi:cytochrome c oxidase cbb3-type subunit 3
VSQDLADLQALRAPMTAKLAATPIAEIETNAEMLTFAREVGRTAFADNCAPCHGTGGGGAKGFPNLNDDDWLWGGHVDDIRQTIEHGVRSPTDEVTRAGGMPAFGGTGVLDGAAMSTVADFVRSLSGLPTEKGADLVAGAKIFRENCVSCHGPEGRGNREVGAPNLADAVWFYGPEKKTIVEGLSKGRAGMMPSWHMRLDQTTIKALAVYVHSMGGGE